MLLIFFEEIWNWKFFKWIGPLVLDAKQVNSSAIYLLLDPSLNQNGLV